MVDRLLCVLKRVSASARRPGLAQLSVRGISSHEPPVLQLAPKEDAGVENVLDIAREFVHDDVSIEAVLYWDLWVPQQEPGGLVRWELRPQELTVTAHGTQFEESLFVDAGHIQIDFGLESPFLQEQVELTPEAERRIQDNIAKLVKFTSEVEAQCAIRGRILWSEANDNLAQKLIERLQRVQ